MNVLARAFRPDREAEGISGRRRTTEHVGVVVGIDDGGGHGRRADNRAVHATDAD